MDYHEFQQDISKLLSNLEHGTTRINTVVSKPERLFEEEGSTGVATGSPERGC